jgi:hypothetical protein
VEAAILYLAAARFFAQTTLRFNMTYVIGTS